MDQQNYRNIVLAGVLTLVILFGWDQGLRYFYPDAYKPQPVAAASPAAAPSASAPKTAMRNDRAIVPSCYCSAASIPLRTAL